jgi:hypothetical protein
MARPSIYSEELVEEICDRIAQGGAVRVICEDDDMPAEKTIYLWLAKKPEFLQRYEAAIAARTNVHAEELLEIADEEPEFHHHVGWARNRIDARKWLMAHLQPKKYGDKVLLAGADGTSPAKLEVSWQAQPASPSTTPRDGNSSPSTIEPSALPASSLTDELARRSHASTTSSEPLLDVDWSDHDLPILHPTEDKPKP